MIEAPVIRLVVPLSILIPLSRVQIGRYLDPHPVALEVTPSLSWDAQDRQHYLLSRSKFRCKLHTGMGNTGPDRFFVQDLFCTGPDRTGPLHP